MLLDVLQINDHRFILREDMIEKVQTDIVDALHDGGRFVHLPLRAAHDAEVLIGPGVTVLVEQIDHDPEQGSHLPEVDLPGGWDFDI